MWLVTSSQHHHLPRRARARSSAQCMRLSTQHSCSLGVAFEPHLKAAPSIGPRSHRPEFMNAAASIDCFPSYPAVVTAENGAPVRPGRRAGNWFLCVRVLSALWRVTSGSEPFDGEPLTSSLQPTADRMWQSVGLLTCNKHITRLVITTPDVCQFFSISLFGLFSARKEKKKGRLRVCVRAHSVS